MIFACATAVRSRKEGSYNQRFYCCKRYLVFHLYISGHLRGIELGFFLYRTVLASETDKVDSIERKCSGIVIFLVIKNLTGVDRDKESFFCALDMMKCTPRTWESRRGKSFALQKYKEKKYRCIFSPS